MPRSVSSLSLALLMLSLVSCVREPRGDLQPNGPAPASAQRRGDAEEGPPQDGEGEGSLDPEHIQEVLRQELPRIQRCYASELPRDPTLEGAVIVRFVIAPTGAVGKVEVEEETLGSRTVLDCITGRIAALAFDAPAGGSVVVRYPFRFRAG